MDETKNLEPGQELDALVAEKVMGLNVVKNEIRPNKHVKHYRYFWSIGEPYYYDFQGDMQLANPVPPYSQEMNAAWEVVEKLQMDDWVLQLASSEYLNPGEGGVYVKFECKAGARGHFVADADMAAHAICLAALKAAEAYNG